MLPNLQPRLLKPLLPPWRNSRPPRLLLLHLPLQKRCNLPPPKIRQRWRSLNKLRNRQKLPLPLLQNLLP